MNDHWQPGASLSLIKARASLLMKVRDFMWQKEILEVETPYLSHAQNTDPNLDNLITSYHSPHHKESQTLYLHTSPEFAMKRLLAAGSGSIYQIAHVFRDAEQSKQHNPEFSMLEWYRVGFDYYQLMQEIDELLHHLGLEPANRLSYEDAFMDATGLNPHSSSFEQLYACAEKSGLMANDLQSTDLLDYLFSHLVTDKLGLERPCLIYDYPASQAALSTIRKGENYAVAERFELFISGMEIANGYNELSDADELEQRFLREQMQAEKQTGMKKPIDYNLLMAMQSFPDCSGVAVGLDRLLMILTGEQNIEAVINFSIDKA